MEAELMGTHYRHLQFLNCNFPMSCCAVFISSVVFMYNNFQPLLTLLVIFIFSPAVRENGELSIQVTLIRDERYKSRESEVLSHDLL